MLLAYSCSSDSESGYSGGVKHGSPLIDQRDSAEYKTVEIGGKTWMAENLNYAPGSVCEPSLKVCENGRAYNWAVAMGLDDSCKISICKNLIRQGHRGICPAGWHVPSNAEWESNSDKSFHAIFLGNFWWSADEISEGYSYYAYFPNEGEKANLYSNKKDFTCGLRCVKD